MDRRITWAKTKQTIRYLAPPIFVDLAKEVRRRLRREDHGWEYMSEDWDRHNSNRALRGWNVDSIPKLHASRWPAFVAAMESTAPFSVAPEQAVNKDLSGAPYRDPDVLLQHIVMTYAYALALASRRKNAISILDWGGGIGHYYAISRALFPDLELNYSIKDVPEMTMQGQRILPGVTFFDDDQCLLKSYDFVLVSGALQYSEDWRTALLRLGRCAGNFLFINQVPVVHRHASFVILQRPYSHGYNTEYPGWCFQRGELLDAAQAAGLALVREFLHGFKPPVYRAPEQPEYRGYLFQIKT
jgi:putative methyltransferase (TIGR04325 family)